MANVHWALLRVSNAVRAWCFGELDSEKTP